MVQFPKITTENHPISLIYIIENTPSNEKIN
jgi:hypothetical protein